ncbi:Uncharacterized protein HZ326_29146 [Fusarium oxysporum f. sp. albedinis]|nr:Uncharacterized protein HZ326_29146 [Fusarium oxysporum f. sp. albedinis]
MTILRRCVLVEIREPILLIAACASQCDRTGGACVLLQRRGLSQPQRTPTPCPTWLEARSVSRLSRSISVSCLPLMMFGRCRGYRASPTASPASRRSLVVCLLLAPSTTLSYTVDALLLMQTISASLVELSVVWILHRRHCLAVAERTWLEVLRLVPDDSSFSFRLHS